MEEKETESIQVLPDDIRLFIREITLDLQCHRAKSKDELDRMFQKAYKLYSKYKVDKKI